MNNLKTNNGLDIPVVGFGTFLLKGADCSSLVCTAINEGYRLIDTAEAYGNEAEVGEGIRMSGIDRRELFIVTKVNFKSFEHGYETAMASIDKLGTDYLDMVLLHWPYGNYYKTWRDLERLCDEGRIRSIGISNFSPGRMIDLIGYNRTVPAVNQIETNIFCQRRMEHKWLEKYNVLHMAYAPLGQGKANEMFALPEVVSLAEKYSKTPAQILLRFLTQQDVIVIPKSSRKERIRENIDIFDFELTEEEREILRSLDRPDEPHRDSENPEWVEMTMTW